MLNLTEILMPGGKKQLYTLEGGNCCGGGCDGDGGDCCGGDCGGAGGNNCDGDARDEVITL